MKITITGVPPYDGTWDAGESMDDWTNAEWAILKRVSGELPLTVEEKLLGSDVTVVTAIAIIALRRSGRFGRVDEDLLWNAPAISYTVDFTRDADGDEEPADPSPKSEPGGEANTPGTPSGSPSPPASEPPAAILDRTGTPSSGTPASDLETSTT